MNLEKFTIVELSACIVSVIGAIGLCLKVLFNSRCNKIDCCCLKIDRDVIPADNIELNNINP